MHKIFVTEGVVLGKRTAGEANTLVSILTRELGLVRASARSARVEQSKLRYGLETLTLGRFSMVRGKHDWKLTGVENVSHAFVQGGKDSRQRCGKIAKLLLRLIHGEERVPALYATVAEGLAAIARTSTTVDAEAIETVLVLRVLAHLGYLPHTQALAQFIEGEYSVELSAEALKSRSLLVRAINESLIATGL
ncbi:MAG TPA: DNA repair protein RecO [Candidatus Paceibacterota bacterium]|jgi:DNA repair protein RecO|nr:DNA repair protein RecO [Candidatus Paceibacterota bacterium]